ncbi:hypothetical protein HMPREF9420_2181 [Segatella salivae DSM 15606]|uniref:Uncharacterized protein n=1 Tax=Segatella salivae DSM 15606 TaxID=888832 RepID=E6MRR3_9BACT|nr:hypothetical protein HMPREF9420_2181 [Segatella salivae DSM 15606]
MGFCHRKEATQKNKERNAQIHINKVLIKENKIIFHHLDLEVIKTKSSSCHFNITT